MKLLQKCSFVSNVHDKTCEIDSIFVPQTLCMVSGDIDKFHNFQISFAFFRILK
jgi:hypothetical protein